MFDGYMYDLSRLKYHEYNARLNTLYEPLRETKVSLAHRLLTALASARVNRARRAAAKPARSHAAAGGK